MVRNETGGWRRFWAKRIPGLREIYGPAHYGTKEIDTEPHDMFYCDIAPLPPVIHIDGGKTFPLPLAVIAAVINRSSHRIINRRCTCRTTFDCQSYDKGIGCVHIGGPTAEEPDSVARHVSKEEAIAHVKHAIDLGLLPFVGKMDVDNEVWESGPASRSSRSAFAALAAVFQDVVINIFTPFRRNGSSIPPMG